MIKNITIGQYFPADTMIHRLDPRIKIIIVFMFIVSLFFITSFYPYLLILAFIMLTIKLAKIPVRYVLKGLKPLMFIIVITFLINIFMTKGEVILEIGPQYYKGGHQAGSFHGTKAYISSYWYIFTDIDNITNIIN